MPDMNQPDMQALEIAGAPTMPNTENPPIAGAVSPGDLSWPFS